MREINLNFINSLASLSSEQWLTLRPKSPSGLLVVDEIQKGLGESLTGRFILHQVHQWTFEESQKAYGLTLEEFLCFGGYPGSYHFIKDRVQWLNYIKNSIIETVIGKDIIKSQFTKDFTSLPGTLLFYEGC